MSDGGGALTTTVTTPTTASMATSVASHVATSTTSSRCEQATSVSPTSTADKRDYLQKRGSKSRLSKQDEVEEVEAEDTSPNSETSDATIVATGGEGEQQVFHASNNSSNGAADNVAEACDHPSLVAQSSTDSSKGSSKNRLKRSEAVSDDIPPPDVQPIRGYGDVPTSDIALPHNVYPSSNTLQVSPMPNRRKTGHLSKDNSQGSFNSENGSASGLSRESSFETQPYTDTTGIDLEKFIQSTLNKNTKDRSMLLKLEQEFHEFVETSREQYLKFPQMSSYHRMLIHRIAAFFGLDHNVDQSGKAVIVNKMPNTRIPDFKFSDHLQDIVEEQPKKIILRKDREYASLDEAEKGGSLDISKKSKSFEERKEYYYTVKKRIWEQENAQQESAQDVSPSRSKGHAGSSSREDVHKWVHDNPRPWASTDSPEYSTEPRGARHKMSTSKASSFSGSSSITRGDSQTSTRSMLSSGSKMSIPESTRSGDSGISSVRYPPIPSSPENQATSESESSHSISSPHTEVCPGITNEHGQQMAFWVCTTVDAIPPGSIIINPATRQPFTNEDGTSYRWPSVRTSPINPQLPSASQHAPYIEHKYQDQSQEVSQQMQHHHIPPQFTPLHLAPHPTQAHPESQPHQGAGDCVEPPQAPPPSHMHPPPHPPVPGGAPVPAYPPPAMSPPQQQQFIHGVPQYQFCPGQQPGVPVRYMYQPQHVPQGQMSQTEGQLQGQEVTYQGQSYGCSVMGIGQNLTVQSVENHQQVYPSQGVAPPPQAYPPSPHEMSAPSQYATQGISGTAVSHPVPVVQPGQYYTPNPGSGQVVTFQSGSGQVTSYRALTPPSQVGQVGQVGGAYPVIGGGGQPQANLAGGAIAQAPVPPQYVAYSTYPAPNTVSVPAPGVPTHPPNRALTPVLTYAMPPNQQYIVRQPNLHIHAARSATPPTFNPIGQCQPMKMKATAEAGIEGEINHTHMAVAPPMIVSQGARPAVLFRPPFGPGGDARLPGPGYRHPGPPMHFPSDVYRPRMPISVPMPHIATSITPPGNQGQQPNNGNQTSHPINQSGNQSSQHPSNRSIGSNQSGFHPNNGNRGQQAPSNAGRQGRVAFAKSNTREGSGGSGSTQSCTPEP